MKKMLLRVSALSLVLFMLSGTVVFSADSVKLDPGLKTALDAAEDEDIFTVCVSLDYVFDDTSVPEPSRGASLEEIHAWRAELAEASEEFYTKKNGEFIEKLGDAAENAEADTMSPLVTCEIAKKNVPVLLGFEEVLFVFSADTAPAPLSDASEVYGNEYAGETIAYYTVGPDGEERTHYDIRSGYFAAAAEKLLAVNYGSYTDGKTDVTYSSFLSDPAGDGGKIGKKLYSLVKAGGYEYYDICLYLTGEGETADIIGKIGGVTEVIYAGTDVPAAVVKVKSGDDIDTILASDAVEYAGIGFDPIYNFGVAPEGEICTYEPDAAHARRLLRYSAGLDKYDTAVMQIDELRELLLYSDVDFNGKIDASDARSALRISASLDASVTFITDRDPVFG